jgi:predicted nucleotidyltransferase
MFKELNIMEIFFESSAREFGVREAARLLKVAPATASKELKALAGRGLLKERKERVYNIYKANLESDFYTDLKVFYNIRKIRESGLMENLNRFYLKPTVILFGSSAHGLDTETSDLDIVIISENTKIPDFGTLEKKLKRRIHVFAVRHIKELKNEHLINNVLNGIVLQGEVKWI